MRGRYSSDGRIEQKIEIREDELSNAITTVQKDSLVIVMKRGLRRKAPLLEQRMDGEWK